MVVWFYFLWSIAVIRVLCSPFGKAIKLILWGSTITAGIWLIAGALTYQTQYATHLIERQKFEDQKHLFYEKKAKLESLYTTHPTAADVLIGLASLSYQLGEHERVLHYVSLLKAVDPNSSKVNQLLRQLQ